MKKLTLAIAVFAFAATSAFAQLKTPQPSPKGNLTQMVGLNEIMVDYSRPGMKDRTIFGDLVPYDKMWRTGANSSTKIEVDGDVTMAGKDVPAGKYALFTIPGESEWTIILNKNVENWGMDEYKQEEDLVRFTIKPTKLNDKVETFTIDFSNLTLTGAWLNLSWENTRISIPVETKANEMVEKQIKEMLIDGPSTGTYYNAAKFYLANNKELPQALAWIDMAIEKRPEAFWYVHVKAKIQGEMGNTKEAIATAEKSIEMAKASKDGDYGYVANNEKLIAKLKGKK